MDTASERACPAHCHSVRVRHSIVRSGSSRAATAEARVSGSGRFQHRVLFATDLWVEAIQRLRPGPTDAGVSPRSPRDPRGRNRVWVPDSTARRVGLSDALAMRRSSRHARLRGWPLARSSHIPSCSGPGTHPKHATPSRVREQLADRVRPLPLSPVCPRQARTRLPVPLPRTRGGLRPRSGDAGESADEPGGAVFQRNRMGSDRGSVRRRAAAARLRGTPRAPAYAAASLPRGCGTRWSGLSCAWTRRSPAGRPGARSAFTGRSGGSRGPSPPRSSWVSPIPPFRTALVGTW